MNINFYMKFPSVFRDDLISGIVAFETEPEVTFKTFNAYRGVFKKKGETYVPITKLDFESQAEKQERVNNNIQRRNRSQIKDRLGFYSCSVFTDKTDIFTALKFPQDDRCVVSGSVSDTNGCIRRSSDNSHIDWWLYETTEDFWKYFRVVEL